MTQHNISRSEAFQPRRGVVVQELPRRANRVKPWAIAGAVWGVTALIIDVRIGFPLASIVSGAVAMLAYLWPLAGK